MSEKTFSPSELNIPEADWEQTPASVRAVVMALYHRVQQVDALEKRVAELEEQLKLNSATSSKPPSSDGPQHKREKTSKAPSGRKRGGQSGHKGQHRQLVPPEAVSEFISYRPETCAYCGVTLAGQDANPLRWQITELPPVKAIVTEHQIHRLCCPSCGKTTRAQLPAHIAKSQFGDRLTAFINLLMAQYRLSKRQVKRLLAEGFNIDISLGGIIRRQEEMSAALASPVEAITDQVRQAKVRYIDETGWRQGHQRGFLWCVVSDKATLFHLARTRTRHIARQLLSDVEDRVAVSDRFTAYDWIAHPKHQTCWAHLLRHFRRFELRDGQSQTAGGMLLMYGEYLLHRWRQLKDGTISRREFQNELPRHREMIYKWLHFGTHCDHRRTRISCQKILAQYETLFVFTRYPNVDPTNNVCERALRHPVIWRKLCYGNDSDAGITYVERILSVLATCRHQNLNPYDFLQRLVQADRRALPLPALFS
ncbi:IS66 family transposase [bacterium]|nr:IS66 family transposase [bacterium]